MSGAIIFSSETYNRLIDELGTLGDGLHEATTGTFPLTDDVQVQPAGQVWDVADDFVTAARKQFTAMHQWNSATEDAVSGLRTSLSRAKGVLQGVDDLATLEASKFQPELGNWAGPNGNQISIPIGPVQTPAGSQNPRTAS